MVSIVLHVFSSLFIVQCNFYQKKKLLMDPNTFINALFLFLVNVYFMIAEVFRTSFVMISLERLRQPRKKPCHFMILLLSCFDLAVITCSNSILILSTIFLSNSKLTIRMKVNTIDVCDRQCIDRFFNDCVVNARCLALKYPFFHHVVHATQNTIYFYYSCENTPKYLT